MAPRITLRLTDSLHAALSKRASATGRPVSTYMIAALAEHCGLPIEPRPQGFAALAPEKRAELARKGGWKSRKKPPAGKKVSGRKSK